MDAEARALLQLILTPGIGPRSLQLLMAAFGSADAAASASRAQLRSIAGVRSALADAIVATRDGTRVDDELALCAAQQVRLIWQGTAAYPAMLSEIADPPAMLYLHGELLPADQLAVAIVGTRHASRYGLQQAERLATSLSRAGLAIVSGLARGIDVAAHRAALAAGGRTIAVMAGGLSEIYPPEHTETAQQIRSQGALISEVALTCKPRRGSFPRRNRIISGMTLGVLVVEATERSGALITARHALEQGREVFAVPGPIDSRTSRGCHALIRDGAKLVQSVEDVLDELGPLPVPVSRGPGDLVHNGRELQLNPQEQTVLQAITDASTHVDQIVARSGLPVQRVLATISVLETRHLVRRVGGDRVARR